LSGRALIAKRVVGRKLAAAALSRVPRTVLAREEPATPVMRDLEGNQFCLVDS
jgi:hypothetical protein